MHRDTRRVIDAAERQGLTTRRTRRGHTLVYDRRGRPAACFAGSPSDWRGVRNGIANLRRQAGFVWPDPR